MVGQMSPGLVRIFERAKKAGGDLKLAWDRIKSELPCTPATCL